MNAGDSRRDRLRARLTDAGLDAFLVSNSKNVSYLTGFSGDSSYLVIGRDKTLLVSDGRYAEQIERECPGLESYIRQTTGEKMADAVANVARGMKLRRVAFESSSLTVAEFEAIQRSLPTAELVGWEGAAETQRAVKDDEELRLIRAAIGFAERSFEIFRSSVQLGDSEKQLADRMEMLLRQNGAERGAFETIIAVGPRAALPHARPGDTCIDEEVPVLVDWGARGRFYHSDLTRVLVSRRIPAKLESVYEVVLQAQERAIRKIRPGIAAKEIDAEARATIEESGFGRFFTHGTGHGIGLDVHEAPALRPNSDMILQAGMVVTVEPGIYLRGWGGVRIEDDVLVTHDGHEVLTTLPKTLDSMLIHSGN